MAWGSPPYTHRIQVTIPAAAGGYASGQVVKCAGWETLIPIAQGIMRHDRKDLRVVYGSSEIDRLLIDTGTICFRLQASIPANTASLDYSIYFGCASEETEPKSNPRNVWPAYFDGANLDGLTISGSISTPTVPRPGAIKCYSNPTIRGTPGTTDQDGVRDADGMLWNPADSKYYVWYDGDDMGTFDGVLGWETHAARSSDLITWEKLGTQIHVTPGPWVGNPHVYGDYSDNGSASAAIVHKFDWDPKYYMSYLGCPNPTTDPSYAYVLHGAWSNNILGPWTKVGQILPLDAQEVCTADGEIMSFDGGATYVCVYGTGDGSQNGVNIATGATSPFGPWTDRYSMVSIAERVENPRLLRDDAHGAWMCVANHINQLAGYTDANYIYWGTGGVTSQMVNHTTFLEPDPDPAKWDSMVLGLASKPVFRGGVMYMAYDGADAAVMGIQNSLGHRFRSVGIAETRWPLPWGPAIRSVNATLESPVLLAGDGVVNVRGIISPGGRVGLRSANHRYDLLTTAGFTQYDFPTTYWASDVDGTIAYPGPEANHVKTMRFARSAGTIKAMGADATLIQGPVTSEPLRLYASGPLTIEEAWVEPAAFVPASMAEPVFMLSASAGPIVGSSVTLSGTRVPGSTVTVT